MLCWHSKCPGDVSIRSLDSLPSSLVGVNDDTFITGTLSTTHEHWIVPYAKWVYGIYTLSMGLFVVGLG